MRILMLSHGYPPTISGVTVVVQKVARAMVERGHQVTLITASDRGQPYEDEDQGVRLVRIRSGTNPFWSEGRLPLLRSDRLKQIVDQVQPDVINTHDGALLSWQLTRLNQEKSAIPEVLTAHFLPRFVRYYARVGDTIDRVLEDLTWGITLRMINAFDHVVFPTVTQQSLFHQEGLLAPSIVISNGIDTGRYQPGGIAPELEQRYSLPDRPRLLFVGRLAPDKKISILIEALAKLDQASLLLVGRGDYRKRLENLVGELGVMERVHFLGFVPEQDLPDVYRASDLFIIASDVEVQSIPTLQAASSGLPIVAANAAALPEIVEDGVNGYLVPSNDPNVFAAKVRQLLESPEQATKFGHASLSIGRRHANVKTFAEYERLYRDVSESNRVQTDPR